MSHIRSTDTEPEMVVRRLVHGMGYRYSLHKASLPGKPDIVLTRHEKIILVHGCFWHMHDCKYGCVEPKTNAEYWQKKRRKNAQRDQQSIERLREMGWHVLVVWECETKDIASLRVRLRQFLEDEET